MKNKIIYGCAFLFILILSVVFFNLESDKCSYNTCNKGSIEGTVISSSDNKLVIKDKNDVRYTFSVKDISVDSGSNIVLEYTGLLDKNTKIQNVSITDYKVTPVSQDSENLLVNLNDNGIFSKYYTLAGNYINKLTLDEKIGQLFLVRYPDSNQAEILKKYNFAGYVFFEKDFRNKTENEVKNMMSKLQDEVKTPILTAVDEEGGKVVRVSSNPKLVAEKFKSPRQLYTEGGFNLIKDDTIKKSKVLSNLGINVNLAPVVDVSVDSNSYMYERTLGENTALTSTFAKTVIDASKGTGVSYVLKHFPGYGNNSDTHNGTATDNRTYDDILSNDLPPFEAGIDSGAEAVLVSHNIVTSIDSTNPASLSPSVHTLLRNELDFTGIIITDDLAMGAVSNIDNNVVKAVLAGNDLIIVTDYENSIKSIKNALKDGTLDEDTINKLATRIVAWKYYKGLMFINSK